MKNRSRKFKTSILLLIIVFLTSLVPSLPAVFASTNQPIEIDIPPLYATPPDIEWEKTFSGSYTDTGYSVQQTNDGGFVIVGAITGDVCLIKTDISGNQMWSKTFDGSGAGYEYSGQQTSDGGFVIVGSNMFIKTDASGNQLWSKILDSSGDNRAYSIQQTSDGGFVITGSTSSSSAGGYDVYLIKTDALGNQQWSKTFGGPQSDWGRSVQQTTDGGFIIAGYTRSFGAGHNDVYLVKTDASGNQLWSKTFGGSGDDRAYSIQQTSDSGFIITGYTYSFGAGRWDVYLVKTDASGNQMWSQTFGDSNEDGGFSVQQITDGGFVIAGYRNFQGYIIKTDVSGNQMWSQTFGSDGGYACAYSVQQTSDGGFVITGHISSSDDGEGVYLMKIAAEAPNFTSNPATTPMSTSTSTSSSTPTWLIGGIGGGIALVMILVFIAIDKKSGKKRVINASIRQLKSQMEKWRAEGYDVSDLEDLFR